MYIPFEEMPAHARVWIYQASRALSATEEAYALQLGQTVFQQMGGTWQRSEIIGPVVLSSVSGDCCR